VIRIRKENVRFDKEIIGRISALGISPFIMQSTESLVMITLNTGLQRYGGDLYVGTMSIMTSIMQLIIVPVQGVTQGVQPIMSYNYGAGNYARVKAVFTRMIAVCLSSTLILGGIAVLKPEIYATMFSNNQELVTLTCQAMPIYFLGMTIFGIQMGCQTTFMALGQAKVSLLLACLRKLILLIPLIFVLPLLFGDKVLAVFLAEPISDITAAAVTTITFFVYFKRLLAEAEKRSEK
jgi:Na+-driven multidrug efflux pump